MSGIECSAYAGLRSWKQIELGGIVQEPEWRKQRDLVSSQRAIMITSPADFAAYYVERLRGDDAENAFFRLIEADAAVLPYLMRAFGSDENREIRPEIVRCIWQHRRPESIGFLVRVSLISARLARGSAPIVRLG
jgi:hypothetical protein